MKNWASAQAVFQALNEKYTYLVIRNFESFYDSILMDTHADIDLLCRKDDRKAILALLDAQPRLERNDGIHYRIMIGSEWIPIDLRYVGDGYYDGAWEKSMLSARVLDERGFYRMDTDHYFWSLLYHALYQKGKISEEYYSRLQTMKPDLFPASPEELEKKLSAYMLEHDYYYTIGRDPYLWYFFPEHCSDRMRISLLYRVRMFAVKCREYAAYHFGRGRKHEH